MANFFLDNKDLQFHLQHPLMRKIVALKERNYTLKDHHELAPQNFEDAMDNYRRVLEIDRKSTRLNSSHTRPSRMPSSA